MKKTIRKIRSTATLDAAKKEKLVYALNKVGPGADFVMADEASDETIPPIFSEEDLGGSLKNNYKWELRSEVVTPPGNNKEIHLAFHRTDGTPFGSRTHVSADPDGFKTFTFVMTFMFLGKYTLVVNRTDSTGKVLETIVDADFEGQQHTDVADNSIVVQWKGL